MATIATHNGSQVRQAHNSRSMGTVSKEEHIYAEGTVRPNGRPAHSEIWLHESVKKAYKRLFGKAQDAYNARVRSDRRIKDYYTQMKNDKVQHPVYEMIVGVYDKGELPESLSKKILQEYCEGWAERNPNLVLIGAYYHDDEQGKEPHLHLDYIPIAHGYTRGMETQAGLVRALEEQGFKTKGAKATAQIQWERRENRELERICKAHGLTIEHPQAGKGVEHLHTMTYKAQERHREVTRELNMLDRQIVAKNGKIERLREDVDRARAEKKISRKSVKMSMPEYIDLKEAKIERDQLKERERQIDEKSLQNREREREIERAREFERGWNRTREEYNRAVERLQERERNLNHEVERRAQERAQELHSAQERRMRDYMQEITFSNGKTALQAFEERERAYKHEHEWHHGR